MSQFDYNRKVNEEIIERGIGVIAEHYPVKKLDAGKFARPVTMNTQFAIAHYEVEGVGHIMTMLTEDNPQMQMATYTFTPYFKKLPLISTDYVFNADGGMFLIEVYELVDNRLDPKFQEWIARFKEKLDEIGFLTAIPTQPCFYDEIRPVYVCKKRDMSKDPESVQNLIDVLKIFCEMEAEYPLLTEDEKKAQAAIQHKYVDDLIDLNGVSTQLWVKEHGADYVREYFHDIFFGV